MGITIKDAPLVEHLSGYEKIPISDGSNEPKTVNIEQIKEFANKDIEIPTKVSELENDSDYATSKEVEDAISKIPTPDVGGQISAALVDYVKKVEGKGLSTNDFTNELKEKLEGITPYDPSELEAEIGKLETAINTLVGGNASNAIESFNEIIAFLKNVSDTESLSGIIAGINARIAEVDAKIPTKVSELENDKNYLTEHQSLSHLATKDELKSKQDVISDLANIREGAAKGATAIQEEQYKGTIAAVDTNESVDDPNVPSGSYDDTELKNQIANLETEVSKKADEAETASKLSELGSHIRKKNIYKKDYEIFGDDYRVGTYLDDVEGEIINIELTQDRINNVSVHPVISANLRTEFPYVGRKGLESVNVDGCGHTWTGQFVEITGDCTFENVNFDKTSIYLSSGVNKSYSVTFLNCSFLDSVVSESVYNGQPHTFAKIKLTIKKCNFSTTQPLECVVIGVAENSIIEDCFFEGIVLPKGDTRVTRGIKCYGGDNITLRNCRFKGFINGFIFVNCPEDIAKNTDGVGFLRNSTFYNNTFILCKEEAISNDVASSDIRKGNGFVVLSYTQKPVGFEASNKNIADITTIKLDYPDEYFEYRRGFLALNVTKGYSAKRASITKIKRNNNDTDWTLFDIELEDGSVIYDSSETLNPTIGETKFAVWASFYRNVIKSNNFIGCQAPIHMGVLDVDNVIDSNIANGEDSTIRLSSHGCKNDVYSPVAGSIGNIVTGNVFGKLAIVKSEDYVKPSDNIIQTAVVDNIISLNKFGRLLVEVEEKNTFLENTIDSVLNKAPNSIGWNNNNNIGLRPSIQKSLYSRSKNAFSPHYSSRPILLGREMCVEMCINVKEVDEVNARRTLFGSEADSTTDIDSLFSLHFCPKSDKTFAQIELRSYETRSNTKDIPEYYQAADYLNKDMVFIAKRNDSTMSLNVNGEDIFSVDAPMTKFSGTARFVLFSQKKMGTTTSSTYTGECYVKYLRIWVDGELIRDFYPSIGFGGYHGLFDTIVGDSIEFSPID